MGVPGVEDKIRAWEESVVLLYSCLWLPDCSDRCVTTDSCNAFMLCLCKGACARRLDMNPGESCCISLLLAFFK